MSDTISGNSPEPLVLIGTYTEQEESKSEGVYVYQLDSPSGKLTYQTVIKDLPNVSFMARHPQLGLVYAVNETENFEGTPGGGVSAISMTDFRILNKQSSGGAHPAYISIEKTGRFALVGNYKAGNVAMFPIQADGRLGEASDIVQHSGSSVDPERQKAPHPHCIIPDPTNRFAVAVDLGADTLFVYRMDLEAGKLRKHAEVPVEAGSGPRHLIFNSSGQRAYLINELNSTIVVYQFRSTDGAFHKIQAISTLPKDFYGINYCSDLHLSSDERQLYASNRRHDSLVCFKVDSTNGELAYQSHLPSLGHEPRIFAIDPSGRFIVAVHQRSNNVVVYKIDPETGDLAHTGHQAELDMPGHVLFV